jgi:hypothetical protein
MFPSISYAAQRFTVEIHGGSRYLGENADFEPFEPF